MIAKNNSENALRILAAALITVALLLCPSSGAADNPPGGDRPGAHNHTVQGQVEHTITPSAPNVRPEDTALNRGMCPVPSSGSCFLPHPTPGCEDSECCAMVCNQDPSCCTNEWDAACVALAQQLCDCARCPADGIFEQEPCGQNTVNPGCDTPPPHMFSKIGCGDDFCGELWADMGQADTDWLQIDVSDPTGTGQSYVCVDLFTHAPIVAEMYTGNCGNLTLVAQEETQDCNVAQLCACVPAPGVVYVKIYLGTIAGGPIIDNYPCGVTDNRYRVHVSCTDCPDPEGACCRPIPGTDEYDCFITTQADCESDPTSIWLGPNTNCTSDPCNPPPDTGACCFLGPAGFTCIQTTQANCDTLPSSTWFGANTNCDPALCEPMTETGACCFQIKGTVIFDCVVTTEQDCINNFFNSTYQGDNTNCTSYTCAPCIDPPFGMVAWWPMDETFGSVVHDSVNTNHGLRAGATPPSTVAGAVNNALNFDGVSSHVRVPDDPTLNFGAATQADAGDFSIDAWIRMDQFTAQQAPIVDKRDQQPRGYYFFVLDGHLALIIEDGIGPPATFYISNATLLPINQLLHVAVTVDRDDPQGVRFYVDGAPFGLTGDPTQHTGNLTNADALYIGANKFNYFPGDGQAFFDGMIDEVEIFDRELSASEVSDLYNAGSDGKCKSTCHLPWDEPFCANENEITVTATVCNWSPITQTYAMTFSPEPVGPGCTIPGPTLFNVVGPNPVTVPPNQCVPVQVKITRPTNMNNVYDIGCYKMTITSQTTGHSFVCHGSVQDRRDLCAVYDPGPGGGVVIGGVILVPWPGPGPIVGSFEVAEARSDLGRGDTISVPIEIRATGGNMLPSDNLSLDGLPPGKPVVRTIKLPPGETSSINFDIEFLEHNPFDIHDIVLYTDMDMDGNYEAAKSIGARSVESLPCPADLTGSNDALPDGTVNVFDLLALLANWSSNGPGAALDAPYDTIDVFDLLKLLAGWGDCD